MGFSLKYDVSSIYFEDYLICLGATDNPLDLRHGPLIGRLVAMYISAVLF